MIKIIFKLILKAIAHFRTLHLKIEELMVERNKLKKEIQQLKNQKEKYERRDPITRIHY